MDLAKIFAHSNCSLLQGSSEDVPQGTYAEQLEAQSDSTVSTYVPFRNGLFLSTAASIALEYACDVIYYGPHADDAAGNAYPDCSPEFNAAMQQAIYLGSGKKLRLEAPFVDKTKKDIVHEGLRLGVPYELTWSCYEGKDEPCHKCGTCLDREAAFAANGVSRPISRKGASIMRVNFSNQKLVFSALCIALYIVVMICTQTFAFGQYQIRIATALYSLSAIFPVFNSSFWYC